MAQIAITLDGSPQQLEEGTTGTELFAGRTEIIALRIDAELRDLATPLVNGQIVEGVEISSEDGLSILRHSAAHVLAQAVQVTNPEAKLGIGPPIADGFYYDFDVAEPFTPESLKALEKEMNRIIKSGQRFVRREITDDAARVEEAGEPYKLELIGLKSTAGDAADGASVEVGEGGLSMYDNVDKKGQTVWTDLCRGPHLPTTKLIGNGFALTRSAAAYWRGSEKNSMLQRVYGTAWPSKDELRAYQERVAEAERRDHRRLGNELDLFSFPDEIGSGLPGVPIPEGHDQDGDGGLLPSPPRRGRLLLRLHPSHHEEEPLRDLQTPRVVRRGHVPADARGRGGGRGRERHQAGAGLLPQAHELPDAQPHLQLPRQVLPRAAAASLRVRQRLPLREVRRGARADPCSWLHPGRRAHLHHA